MEDARIPNYKSKYLTFLYFKVIQKKDQNNNPKWKWL
jgi:hypothetical protein